mmetsp:Transcript_8066/g.12850  ORF Transcript_8066/g.12850 Transcript_8066/m.12850 type:complete len:123 (+) Transcript_8066:88-456(+)
MQWPSFRLILCACPAISLKQTGYPRHAVPCTSKHGCELGEVSPKGAIAVNETFLIDENDSVGSLSESDQLNMHGIYNQVKCKRTCVPSWVGMLHVVIEESIDRASRLLKNPLSHLISHSRSV